MRRFGLFAALAVSALLAAPAAAQVTATSDTYAAMPASGFTYDFDGSVPAYVGGLVRTGPSTSTGAVPIASTGNFFAVGPSTGGTASISFADFGQPISAVSFLLGSADSYNLFQFFGANGNLGKLFTGSDFAAPANGDQFSGVTNRWVTVNFAGDLAQGVQGVRLRSGTEALELDNIKLTAAVPEPATWAMMLVGFGGVGFAMRRKTRAAGARGLATA